MLAIDINCDMGESTSLWQYSIDKDVELLKYISSVNIACGFHAGDPHTIHELVEAALIAGIGIGAHPSFPDKENFGRTDMIVAPDKLYDIVLYQLGALNAFLKIQGASLHHVKPHGAMYNMAAKDFLLAEAICRAVKDFDAGLILYGLSGSELIQAGSSIGLKTCSEVFADRSYQDDGSLTQRSQPGSLIKDESRSLQQVLQMIEKATVTSINGKEVSIVAETVCIHSDGLNALNFAQNIYRLLKEKKINISYPANL